MSEGAEFKRCSGEQPAVRRQRDRTKRFRLSLYSENELRRWQGPENIFDVQFLSLRTSAFGSGLNSGILFLLAWATVIPLQDGIDVSMVGEGMEMFGASSVLYPELLLYDVIMANVIVVVLGIVASLSPAWRASRYQPIEAINKA